jgi:hypothetical protein
MRSSRVKLLLGALLVVVFAFTLVNAHGDHGHHHRGHPVADDLEDDEFTTAASSETEPTPIKSVELPTFTVFPILD